MSWHSSFGYGRKGTLTEKRWLLHVGLWSLILAYLAQQAGWIVAEVGRQPWAIQDLLPVNAAVSSLSVTNVQITFALFFVVFTALLIAELRIMFNGYFQPSSGIPHFLRHGRANYCTFVHGSGGRKAVDTSFSHPPRGEVPDRAQQELAHGRNGCAATVYFPSPYSLSS